MQRAMPAIVMLVATLGGAGGAWGVNVLIASQVAPEEPAPTASDHSGPSTTASNASTVSTARPRAKSERVYLEGILCRNMFDPDAVGDCALTEASNSGALSDLPVTLVGTMVARPASYSVAFIVEEGQEAGSYGIDDDLLDATVIAIAQHEVTVRRKNGREEILRMEEGAQRKPARTSGNSEDGDDEVTKLGDNRYSVSRDLIDKYINDIESISRMGRALLHRGPDGEYDGYRLSAIRRNTLADKLGIRNGDVIHSVNGKDLNSVQSAMEAYQTMASEGNFSFEVTRRGQRTTLDYEVQ